MILTYSNLFFNIQICGNFLSFILFNLRCSILRSPLICALNNLLRSLWLLLGLWVNVGVNLSLNSQLLKSMSPFLQNVIWLIKSLRWLNLLINSFTAILSYISKIQKLIIGFRVVSIE